MTEDRVCEAICELKCSTYLEYILLVLVIFRNMGLKARLCVCFEVHEINEDSKKLQAALNKSKPTKEQAETKVARTSGTKRKSNTTEQTASGKSSKGMPKKKRQKSTTSLAGKLSQLSDNESEWSEEEDDDSDSEPKSKKKPVASRAKKVVAKKKPIDKDVEDEEKDRSKNLIKKPTLKKSNSQILSSEEAVEVAGTSKPKVCREAGAKNYWLEVYLDEERMWQPIDPLNVKTNLVGDYFEDRFEKQILYTCAFDNDNRVKDVTKRYSSMWTTSTRLLRVDFIEKKLWWERTMLLKQVLDPDLDIEEEQQLKSDYFLTFYFECYYF